MVQSLSGQFRGQQRGGHGAFRARISAFALLLVVEACAPAIRTQGVVPATEPARRLVLALDGIDYRDIVAAREQGMFAQFKTPSRLVSTFPSISDISWHDIFGVQAPRGYQRIYYSNGYNAVFGEMLDAIRPIEFEDRMDMAFGAKFHHLSAYLASNTVSRREVDQTVKNFFKITGRRTVYVYNVGPDAMQHTRGDLEKYLRHLDLRLGELQVEYRERTGRSLEIVLLSDHGHNRAHDAKFLPISDALHAKGFHASEQLRSPTDVAFSVDGVTTGFGVFCVPDSVQSVSRVIADMEGVDIVTARISSTRFRVLSGKEEAFIDRRYVNGVEQFRYAANVGDPLLYEPILAQMRDANALDADGFADADTWVKYTVTALYPVAPVRIVRGHTTITANPAPILVSVSDNHRVGLGLVSVANKLRPLGGTHGALSSTNSLGVLMTNFTDTHDALTGTVRDQLGDFDDLKEPVWKTPSARITSLRLLNADRLGPFHAPPDTTIDAFGKIGIEIWISTKQLEWAAGDASFVIDTRKLNTGQTNSQNPERDTDRKIWPMQTVLQSKDHLRYFMPLDQLGLTKLDPNATYDVRVAVHHLAKSGDIPRSTSSKALTNIRIRTNERGEVWPN